MEWKKLYKEKMMSFSDAAKLINSGDVIWLGALGSGAPQIVDALAERYKELNNVIVIGDFPLNHYKIFESNKYVGHVEYDTLFLGGFERPFLDKGNIRINIVKFSDSYRALKDMYKVNSMICEVSEPDEDGYMYYGCMGVAWNGKVAQVVDKVIVQVNSFQHRTNGWNHRIHVSQVDAICKCDHKLYEYLQPPVSEIEQKIASYIIPLIEDGSTLQVGIGGVANAVAYGLEDKKNLGIQTEMLTESLVYLAKRGVVDSNRIITAFILGNQETYDFALSNIPKLGPVDEIISPNIASKIPNFIAINSCIMSDLTGQISSETIGHKQYSGTGGQLDCIRSANLSSGGKSFLCMPSRRKMKDGSYVSSICLDFPKGQVVTVPRTDVMFVVTEYGIADLFNQPIEERVYAMISIAHPEYRDELHSQALKAGLIRKYQKKV